MSILSLVSLILATISLILTITRYRKLLIDYEMCIDLVKRYKNIVEVQQEVIKDYEKERLIREESKEIC